MCGIAGIFDRASLLSPAELDNAVARMGERARHRGPDDDGIWSDGPTGIALAHRRLAVIAPTPEGHQPMASRDGRYVLAYNGEIYNFREIARDLAAAGHDVETGSDTVVLAEAIATWGVRDTIPRLVGMFAFAVFDRHERSLALVRDRLGIKPLYWAQQADRILFASELGPIAGSGLVELSRSPEAVAAYLRHGCIPAPATIYNEAHKLAPGTLLEVGPSGPPRIDTYWDAAAVARDGQDDLLPAGDPQVQAETERLLEQAVADRLISDVPLGGWLSGGIDSSCVVALMQAVSSSSVRTFSIGFPAFGYDESADAAATARHLGTDHTELQVTAQETMDVVADMPGVYGEPFADSSQIPTFVLSRLTREHVTVALSGDGGDEVFAGYNRYLALPAILDRAQRWPGPVRRGAASALRFLSPAAWDGVARILPGRTPPQFGDKLWKAADAFEAPDLETAYLHAISQWPADRHGAAHGGPPAPDIRFEEGLADPAARLQLADTQTYLPDDILTKVDRASMAHALEVRVPLLDHRVVEHAWRLPRTDLLGRNTTKVPLRRLLEKHLPRTLFERPKSGFAVPVGDWLRGPLRDWAEDLLSETALADAELLSPQPVRAAWADHLSGRRNLQNALWTVLMLQLWHRQQPT